MTKLLTVRAEEDLLAAFARHCMVRGTSMSVVLREYMRSCVEEAPEKPVPALRPVPPVRRLNPVAQEKAAKGCTHPKDSLQKLGYLTKCGVCGTRVR